MNRCLICVAGLFIGLLTSTRADGQIVRVGPAGGVRVRAPFVRVDVRAIARRFCFQFNDCESDR